MRRCDSVNARGAEGLGPDGAGGQVLAEGGRRAAGGGSCVMCRYLSPRKDRRVCRRRPPMTCPAWLRVRVTRTSQDSASEQLRGLRGRVKAIQSRLASMLKGWAGAGVGGQQPRRFLRSKVATAP